MGREEADSGVVAKGYDSSLWNQIINLCPQFDDFAFRSIGDGTSTPAWSSNWYGLGECIANLNVQIPNSMRNSMVSDLVTTENKWNLEILSDDAGADIYMWSGDLDGGYSVATSYQLLCGSQRQLVSCAGLRIGSLGFLKESGILFGLFVIIV